ncbi:MAG: TonB-dependent receptor [Proteiniphilum sp.]|nr:TonB-dependent receptor [Proteiniphilum sp.]
MKKMEKIDYRSKRNSLMLLLSILCLLFYGANTYAQTATVRGSIKDTRGESLIGVNVIVKGTQQGTISDTEGNFTLSVPSTNSTLEFSYIGYKSQDVALNGRSTINVTLIEDTQALDEIVVVGYGTQKKVNLTGSVQNVSSVDIVKRNVSNTSIALQGLVPGVSIITSTGRPGYDGAGITIRGTGSLNSSSRPLVLIDGVIADAYGLNFIDMNSIESISVLKDAASASIYGSRASNGVILITTKRAKDNKLNISYSGYVGVNSPITMPKPLSAVDYMKSINVARANADMDPQYSNELINDYITLGADNFNRYDTNWRDEIIKNNALTHNNSISLSGGSEAIKVFANLAHFYQDGNIANNDYRRSTLRLNTDAQITKWLKAGIDINVRESKTIQPTNDSPESIINKATTFVPVFSGINDDGTWGYGQNGDNPIASAEASGLNTSTTPELGLKGFLQLNPLNGFEVYTAYSYRKVEGKSDSFLKPYDTYETGTYKTTYPAGGTNKYEGWSQTLTKQFNLQASYEKQISDNYFKILTGLQTEELNGRSFSASRKGFEYDGFEDLDHGNNATATNSGGHYDWAMLSYFGRLNYNYKEKYLAELNGRFDASSRFTKDNRWGFFPSASAGWRISEEAFFESIKHTINNLKLRVSYGVLGNQDIGSFFPYAATISPGYGYWFNKELGSGVAQTQVANENISWEKSAQTNIGLDMSLLNTKLNVTFDYYVRNIDDMLQQFPIPVFVGLGSPWENAGSMRNKGWDLNLTWRDKIGDVNYSITGNLSDVKNEITDLFGKEYIGTQITREGDPIHSWYGYVSDGYFQTQEEIDSSPVFGEKKNIKPGYIKYKDLSGPEGEPDGKIDSFDRTIIGNPSLRYEYSLNFAADWKGLDLNIFFQGVGKKDLFYSGYGVRPFYIGRSMFKNQLDYWSEDNRNAKFPILLIDGSGSNPNNMISDFWVKSGSYLRLKNVVIGYTIPKTITSKYNLSLLRFYVSGQNLLTFTNAYEGYDPENSVSSGSFYPLMRTYTFGLTINF